MDKATALGQLDELIARAKEMAVAGGRNGGRIETAEYAAWQLACARSVREIAGPSSDVLRLVVQEAANPESNGVQLIVGALQLLKQSVERRRDTAES